MSALRPTDVSCYPEVVETKRIIEEEIYVQPVEVIQQEVREIRESETPAVVTTTTGPLPGVTGYPTPCHPITGATGPYAKAIPMGNTTSAFPGMTTFEQTSGIPASTHMYGVPLATYAKGPGGVAVPVATPVTGPLTGPPIVETTVCTAPGPSEGEVLGSGGEVVRETTTHVTDTYTPIGTTATGYVTGGKGSRVTVPAIPDDVGVHHHDRAHHHHVHDRLPVGTAVGPYPTTYPTTTYPTTGVVPTTTTTTKAVGDKEHQIIQDVIPPGRNRVVEHHEKY